MMNQIVASQSQCLADTILKVKSDVKTYDQFYHSVLIRPVRFTFDADGGMSWNADTAIADNEDVLLHRFGIGLCEVYMLIAGQDTPIAVKRGNPVFSTSTDGSTNDSRDGSATINNAQGMAAAIGVAAEDKTTGNATSAANGEYFKVTI